ncbi:hypothetical protein [Algibacter sp. L4_22]|uniref:hypothetical protein n=1 Tax=Algibacter sp. L4_22 TaxID=2942477 RepID=UPI00201B97B5|nr:hypothetical protein [Algibacter sp. L4_22]MCL5128424.1 hypothetical protein [Algibacter sp. L4_22]
MNANRFNICPSCIHQNTCVLTAQKDKVWSCSEYDEENSETIIMLQRDVDETSKNPSPLMMA